ncbi:hypothetical protein GQ53DRAFT_818932 [Thozetella sp. PMI_491]|nr:hypothetical protein GQ53DRAFT_818932 [Thozetella sp. PMI_491]
MIDLRRSCGRLLSQLSGQTKEHPELLQSNQRQQSGSWGAKAGSCQASTDRIFKAQHLLDPAGCHDQRESPFFGRLPIEIRQQIYCLVLQSERQLWVRVVDAKDGAGRGTRTTHQQDKALDQDENALNSGCVENFPCTKPPTDMSYTLWPSGCCVSTAAGFWGKVTVNKINPHQDSLSLMRTCAKVYSELLPLWTFCFDDLDDLDAFAGLACSLAHSPAPVIHVQVVMYPWPSLYKERDPEAAGVDPGDGTILGSDWMQRAWEEDLSRLNTICRRLPSLGTLQVSLMARPIYLRLRNEVEVIKSVERFVTAAPKLTILRLGPPRLGRRVTKSNQSEQRGSVYLDYKIYE